MSIQLALLKSGEEVIADIKEFRNSDDQLVSYFFGNPYAIRVSRPEPQLLTEGTKPVKQEAIYYKWMSLSKDDNIIVDKDWIVCITDPIDSIKQNYEDKINGRHGRSINLRDDIPGTPTSSFNSTAKAVFVSPPGRGVGLGVLSAQGF